MKDDKETMTNRQEPSEEVMAENTESAADGTDLDENSEGTQMDESSARLAGNIVKCSIFEGLRDKTVYCLCIVLFFMILAGTALSSIFIQEIKESRMQEMLSHEDVRLSLKGPAETETPAEADGDDPVAVTDKASEEWKKIIFGNERERAGIGSLLFISGLTESEKKRIGFAEADFVKAVSLFLAGEGLTTKRLIIEDRISCSTDGAMAFQARLQGHDNYILDIIFYPEYPGEYIFTLREVKDNERDQSQQSAGSRVFEAESQTRIQNQISMQEQTEAGQNVQPQSETQQNQRSYDASRLTLENMPEELLNYISNQYTFQFELYDFLYNSGSTNARTVYVSDYAINGEEKSAVISLSVDDGSTLSAVYDRDTDTYSFRR